MSSETPTPPRVGLFVTCLVDLMRPKVGFAAAKLLEDAGCTVEVPPQTCCGQPAFNSGDRATARGLAKQAIETFEPYDYVVVPSGSCAGMMKTHYVELFDHQHDHAWLPRAKAFSDKVFELTSFLVDVLKVERIRAIYDGTVTYHDGCSGLRELGVKQQPRRLLGHVIGLTVAEMADAEACCGFGGTFCVKYPEISGAIVERKVAAIAATGAPQVLSGDLGCLLNIAGRITRDGKPIQARHVAEMLAGMGHEPGIGEPDRS
ncbi:(Fe-S)-binding protein [Blastochloris viridis]|uniref:Lactate utilization protein A n=1 Tax=Blastochloris viridis TaxID=1079 RepID=A0A0H5BD13_BLAVI|nr:(Fe-S)-binding protein [Blastochloris viridis]ALK08522.1 Lactate utilization protein A [Blastochloris viridis]BAR98191.1 predicted L-lactate dehydrogenase [Blastochloris viridis]CUU41184.1 Lactate utilization protein A [Blastochloris viridis]